MKVICKKDIYYSGSSVRRFFKGNYYYISEDISASPCNYFYIKDEALDHIAFIKKRESNLYNFDEFDDYFTMIPELRQSKLKKIC